MRWPELLLAAALAIAAPAAGAQAFTREEVRQAADAVRQHPDLGGRKTVRSLRLRDTDAETPRKQDAESLRWLVDLLRWLADSARFLVWIAGAVLVALLVVGVRRWFQVRGRPFARPPGAPPPTHVQSLDIRPEQLPAQIGPAAAVLWQRGDQVAALSLLYRGALSRLVHGHGVPIAAASTEGECVTLARARLAPSRSLFFANVVAAWQLAVYGARTPDGAEVLALCRDFDRELPLAGAGSTA